MSLNEFVCLSHEDSSNGPSKYLQLPIEIGREVEESRNGFRLDYSKVSRLHATIRRGTNGCVISDESSNGTYVNGIRLQKGQSLTLSASQSIKISIFGIEVISGVGSGFYIRWEESGQYLKCPIYFGHPIVLGRDPKQATLVLNGLDRKASSKHAMISLNSNGTLALKNWSDLNPVLINNLKELSPGGETTCQIGDVLYVGNKRIQLLHSEHKMMECSNDGCGLLSTYNRESECRWCGNHLSNANTIQFRKQVK